MQWVQVATVFVVLSLCLGCGAEQFASVDGMVTLDGKPLPDVEVQFIPDPSQKIQSPPTSAYTDKDGRFKVVAASAFGVAVGKHRVCINDATVMMPGANIDAESGAPTGAATNAGPANRSRVPRIYSDANRTPFSTVDIQPGTQTKNFELQANST